MYDPNQEYLFLNEISHLSPVRSALVLGVYVYTKDNNHFRRSTVTFSNTLANINEIPLIYLSTCTIPLINHGENGFPAPGNNTLVLSCIRNKINFNFSFQAGTAMECLSVRIVQTWEPNRID